MKFAKMSVSIFLICMLALFANVQVIFAQSLPRIDKAQDYFNQAAGYFEKQDMYSAIDALNKAILLYPDNPEFYLNRGYVKQLISDYDGAMADYDKALHINGNYVYAYNNRAVLKVSMQDVEGAMQDYAKALSINPKYSDVYYNRGNLKYMLDDNNGALEDYNIAIELNPKDAEAYNNRGVVKKRLNFNVGALSDYSQAIALNPKDSIAYANRGHLKKMYFDNEGATIDLDQAVALAENQTFIKNVKPLLSKERYIAAIPTLKESSGHVPSTFAIPQNKQNGTLLASVSTQKSQSSITSTLKEVHSNQPASEYQNKQLIQTPDTKQTHQKTVLTTQDRVKTEVKEVKESKPVVQETTKVTYKQEKSPSNTITASVATVQLPPAPTISTSAVTKRPTTNIKLAESYYIRGLQKCVLRDLQGAIADLNKAIENNSKYADAYFYRAAIKKELGDTEGFRKDYAIAIQINPSLQGFNDANSLSLISG